MLPIVDRPSIEYIVREAVSAGITDILIITNRGKSPMEDHFDHSIELEAALKAKGKTELLSSVTELCGLARISYTRQLETRGLGHAVGCAESFVGDEPFVVLYGDDVILGDRPVTGQLIEAYEKYGLPCAAMREVSEQDVKKYSSLKVSPLEGNIYRVTDMVEKPQTKEERFSLFSILGRVLLTPEVFKILKTQKPGAGGEIQLTDTMAVLARDGGMVGVDFEGRRYDMGNKLEIIKANIEVGLSHPETGPGLREYIKQISKSI